MENDKKIFLLGVFVLGLLVYITVAKIKNTTKKGAMTLLIVGVMIGLQIIINITNAG